MLVSTASRPEDSEASDGQLTVVIVLVVVEVADPTNVLHAAMVGASSDSNTSTTIDARGCDSWRARGHERPIVK